jgi:phospholipid/cholesterol/gamma-HCH transport system substrate-binding protein
MKIRHLTAKSIAVVGFSIACVATFGFLLSLAGVRLSLSQRYHINVMLPDAFQLVQNSDVRSAGVTVGHVDAIANRGDVANVKIEITNKSLVPVYRNSTVLLRTKTLVGENYIELDQGDPAAGAVPDGGTLPLTQAEPAVQLDQILATLNPATRAEIRRNLDGLGQGLAGRGTDVNNLFAELTPTVEQGQPVMSILADQHQEFAGVVRYSGQVMQALAERTAQLRELVTAARATATAVRERDAALGATLVQIPATLTQAWHTAGHLGRLRRHRNPGAREPHLWRNPPAAGRRQAPAGRVHRSPAARRAAPVRRGG